MVVFVDLGEEELERPETKGSLPALSPYNSHSLLHNHNHHAHAGTNFSGPVVGAPRFFSHITQAFACYPIVHAVASCLDLNSLHDLALSCRQIRASLLENRTALLTATLRCTNDLLPVNTQETFLLRARAGNYWVSDAAQARQTPAPTKPGPCARDMVGPCRKCGAVICRNCAIKPPQPKSLVERHRRLCQACSRAPLATLAKPPLASDTPFDSDALQGALCCCESKGVFLCQPCGMNIRAADGDYARVWRWRIQYGEVLGGLGTGIGDGDRGVICGRDRACFLSREQEQEMDSVAEDFRTPAATISGVGTPLLSVSFDNSGGGAPWDGASSIARSASASPGPLATDPGYERHEIQGIGGVLKKKLSRMVRVGACVPEWEDERAKRMPVLEREVTGAVRSWCGWCNRPIPGEKDWVHV